MDDAKKVTVPDVAAAPRQGRRLAMVTAYDAPTARIVDAAGVDVILVGDSLGNVVLGYENTLPVTMEDMIRHTAAVVRGTSRALVVADMPFMSYQESAEQARRNAGRLVKEGGAAAVKLEGGVAVAATVAAIVAMDVPVMGHVGLTPQSVHAFGGFRVQGRDEESARKIIDGARALEEAGAFAVVLEGIPSELARRVSEALDIPTIGIGAGPGCDGQVLVLHDMLAMYRGFRPKFVKVYDDIGDRMEKAVAAYVREVKDGSFPAPEHEFQG